MHGMSTVSDLLTGLSVCQAMDVLWAIWVVEAEACYWSFPAESGCSLKGLKMDVRVITHALLVRAYPLCLLIQISWSMGGFINVS